jgi:hypothetical protein
MRADGRPYEIDRRWTEGGDYHGLVAGEGDRFHAVRSDSSTGVFQVHFATIAVGRPAGSGPPPADPIR